MIAGVSAEGTAFRFEEDPFLARIIINNDSVIIPDTARKYYPVNEPMVFNHRYNNLVFEMDARDTMSYCFILEGYDSDWGEWHAGNYKDFDCFLGNS